MRALAPHDAEPDLPVRRLVPGDIPAAVELVNAEGWAFTADDFRSMLSLEPDGLFVVEASADGGDVGGPGGGGAATGSGDIVGLTTTTTFDRTGWIGNVVVRPDHRGRGLGTAVVQAALDHLFGRGLSRVGLYALEGSLPLYERLGFQPVGEVVAVTGTLPDPEGGAGGGAGDGAGPPSGRPPLDAILRIDRVHAADDRSRVLAHLHGLEGTRAVVADDGSGYLFARPGAVWELGPSVVDPGRPAAFAEMLERVAAGGAVRGPVEASFPADNGAARKAYAERGVTEAYRATTMVKSAPGPGTAEGGSGDPGGTGVAAGDLYDPLAIFGLLGLEKG